MAKIIAMAGKGGTGKTTIAALIVRAIKEKKLGSVLAIDADPNSNLGQLLGANPVDDIGKILDEVSTNPDKIPASMTKERFIQLKAQGAIDEQDGFDLLNMGRPEGPGCYCYANNVLRSVMAKLVNDYDYIVVDNEAGLEHLSRRTLQSADLLIVVSDSSKVGLKSAARINELVGQIKFDVKRKTLLVNMSFPANQQELIKEVGLEHLGNLPLDAEIEKLSFDGKTIFELSDDSGAQKAFNLLGDKIWKLN